MSKKYMLAATGALAALVLMALAGNHYLAVKQISDATGVRVPFASSVSFSRNGGMMGGTIETWVEVQQFSSLLAQCSSDSSYTHGAINYTAFRTVTSQFEERGMGKDLGCMKELRSATSAKFIAIDNGFIYISEQWL